MSEKLKEVQAERGNNYGKFDDHARAVDQIMSILKGVNRSKTKNIDTDWPEGFKTAAFYMTSKLVRLATTPHHVDSALDLSSYADLWLKIIQPEEVCYAEPEEVCCEDVSYPDEEDYCEDVSYPDKEDYCEECPNEEDN